MMLRESLALVGLGLLAGIAAAFSLSRLVAAMLFGLSPADPLTYLATATMLGAVAMAASCLARMARGATRTDRGAARGMTERRTLVIG